MGLQEKAEPLYECLLKARQEKVACREKTPDKNRETRKVHKKRRPACK